MALILILLLNVDPLAMTMFSTVPDRPSSAVVAVYHTCWQQQQQQAEVLSQSAMATYRSNLLNVCDVCACLHYHCTFKDHLQAVVLAMQWLVVGLAVVLAMLNQER